MIVFLEEPISRTIFACNKERNGCSIFEKCCNGLECKGIPFFRTCQKTKGSVFLVVITIAN